MFNRSSWEARPVDDCRRYRLVAGPVLWLASVLGACGGGDGAGGGSSHTYTVGGTVSHLTGSGLVLRNNGGETISLFAPGPFTFATRVADGGSYAVTVSSQPMNPAETCVVTHGSGTIRSNNATDVTVDCTVIVSGRFIGADYGLSGDDGSFGVTPLDGAGNFTSTSVENSAGTIISGEFDTGTYTVSPSGAIFINFNAGAVSVDGNAIVSADMNPGEQAYIDIGVKQDQTGLSNADLAGTYEVVTYGNSGDSASLWTFTADGAGNFTGSVVENNAGVISPGKALTGTYTVAADGSLTLTPGAAAALAGGVSADRETLVLSQLTSAQAPSITVGIKQGASGFTDADLDGTYAVVTQENSGDTGSLWAISFDGGGNFSATGMGNAGGTISKLTLTGTYSVAADGTLTVTPSGDKPLTGSVSSDSQKLLLTNLNPGDRPGIWFGVLRSGGSGPWDY